MSDPKLQDLLARTNLGELLNPVVQEHDLNQPVDLPQPKAVEAARSTTDPLQINFATADIVGKLQDAPTSSGLRTFALVFLGGPMIVIGLGLVVMAWASPERSFFPLLATTVIGLAMAGFWPWVIYRNRRGRAARDPKARHPAARP